MAWRHPHPRTCSPSTSQARGSGPSKPWSGTAESAFAWHVPPCCHLGWNAGPSKRRWEASLDQLCFDGRVHTCSTSLLCAARLQGGRPAPMEPAARLRPLQSAQPRLHANTPRTQHSWARNCMRHPIHALHHSPHKSHILQEGCVQHAVAQIDRSRIRHPEVRPTSDLGPRRHGLLYTSIKTKSPHCRKKCSS